MVAPTQSLNLSGLSTRPGIGIQGVIKSKYGCSVSPVTRGRAFLLVASFGHCKFKLSPSSVGAILQATIGGVADDFDVFPLADQVFHFSVSSSLVGFHIFKLRSFECSSFKVFFHLWSNGGPNWVREWRSFCAEEEASWTDVQKSPTAGKIRPSVTFADAVKSVLLTRANKVPVQAKQPQRSVFDHLLFPSDPRPALSKGKNTIGRGHQASPEPIDTSPSLNHGVASGQWSSANNLTEALAPRICSRCLTAGHAREACKSPIKCFSCLCGGHVAFNCPGGSNWRGKDKELNSNGKEARRI